MGAWILGVDHDGRGGRGDSGRGWTYSPGVYSVKALRPRRLVS